MSKMRKEYDPNRVIKLPDGYYPKDGDQLWCVFDCDDNKDSELQAAILYAEKHGYKIAYSNPAFEYWYLLHFEKRSGYLKDSVAVICWDSNPVTTVYELVEFLNSKRI